MTAPPVLPPPDPWRRLPGFFTCTCALIGLAIIWHRSRHPLEVPSVTSEGTFFHFDNPQALRNCLTVEQYAALYNLDPVTVRALCASGAIKGAVTFNVQARHWLIPASAIHSLRVADLAAAHGVSDRTIRDWIDAGRISPAPVKLNREWHIDPNYQLSPP